MVEKTQPEFESTLEADDFNLHLSDDDIQKAEALKEEIKTVEQEAREQKAAENLKADFEALQIQCKSLEDALLREKAEVENFKRRIQSEQQQLLKYSNQGLMTELLPVLDGFTHAFANAEKTTENEAFFQGFEIVQNQLINALNNAGLKEVTVDGMFDHNVHQAIMTDTVDGFEDDQIIETLQKGYTLHDRTLRAAMVKVNKK